MLRPQRRRQLAPAVRTDRLDRSAIESFGLPGLAFAAGGVDAATYLGLGHAFPANMTGNTVLIGVAVAQGAGQAGLRSAVVLVGFATGVVSGVLLRDRREWPLNAAVPLSVQSGLMLAVIAVWAALGVTNGAVRYPLLGAMGAAMGLQSAASRSGRVPTTYMTGTLTKALVALTDRALRARGDEPHRPHEGELAGGVWLAYGLGALLGALLEVAWGAGALAVPTAVILAATVLVIGVRRRTPERDRSFVREPRQGACGKS